MTGCSPNLQNQTDVGMRGLFLIITEKHETTILGSFQFDVPNVNVLIGYLPCDFWNLQCYICLLIVTNCLIMANIK